jgi:CMP/dCMP kinase
MSKEMPPNSPGIPEVPTSELLSSLESLPEHRPYILTIDGPAAAGKEPLSKMIARSLNFCHLDRGAIFRSVTYSLQKNGISISNEAEVANHLKDLPLELQYTDHEVEIKYEKKDVTPHIRTQEVDATVHLVSPQKAVREYVDNLIRTILKDAPRGIIIDGRDTGTEVVPDANMKIFLWAPLESRAHRRQTEYFLKDHGKRPDFSDIALAIKRRDFADFTRGDSQLRIPDNAIRIDRENIPTHILARFLTNIIRQEHFPKDAIRTPQTPQKVGTMAMYWTLDEGDSDEESQTLIHLQKRYPLNEVENIDAVSYDPLIQFARNEGLPISIKAERVDKGNSCGWELITEIHNILPSHHKSLPLEYPIPDIPLTKSAFSWNNLY